MKIAAGMLTAALIGGALCAGAAGCAKRDSEPAKGAEVKKKEGVPVHLDPRKAKSVLDTANDAAGKLGQSGQDRRDELDKIR